MIFVFGSNQQGAHEGGAARYAFKEKSAAWGVGEGLTGQSYALPTVDMWAPMPIEEVSAAVERFKAFAASRPDLEFQVTRVGCGIAGFSDKDIAAMFEGSPANCLFDDAWRTYLPNAKFWGTF